MVETDANHRRADCAANTAEGGHRAADHARVTAADIKTHRPRGRDTERHQPCRAGEEQRGCCGVTGEHGTHDGRRSQRQTNEPRQAPATAQSEAAREQIAEPAAQEISGSHADHRQGGEPAGGLQVETALGLQVFRQPGEIEIAF